MNEEMNLADEAVNVVVSNPLLRRWLVTLCRGSAPVFDPNTLACDERLAFGAILDQVKDLAEEFLPQPESSGISETQLNKEILELSLDWVAAPETVHAEIAEVSLEEFQKLRRLLSGSGLLRFESVPENSFIWPIAEARNRFRIYLRWTPEVWKKVLIPISETEEGRELLELFATPLVQTIQ